MHRAAAVLVAVLGLSGFLALRSTRASEPPERVLGVLRASPEEVGGQGDAITVTFDRPVAGGLEEMVDAATLIHIDPAVEGRAEWRDPVTLRFTPAAPLEAGATYRVRIDDTFAAMDGSRLPAPYTFAFRVARARVLTGDPVGPYQHNRFLPSEPRFRILLSTATDADALAGAARVELGEGCGAAGAVRLRSLGLRRIGGDDPQIFSYSGATGNDSTHDLRRVVELAPVRPLPAGCAADLVLPASMDSVSGRQLTWPFATYGPLAVLRAGCPADGSCHYGPAEITFSTPVLGAEVLRRVHLGPGRRFVVRDTAESADNWALEGRLDPRRAYTVTVDAGLTDVFGQRLAAASVTQFRTPGVPPSVVYPHGKMVVERQGFRTLAVQHVNVDTLQVAVAQVPRAMEKRFLSHGWGGWGEAWTRLAPTAARRRIAVRNQQDRSAITGVALPAGDARTTQRGTLLAVRVSGRGVKADADDEGEPMALVQVTDLAVHARVGVDQAMVWVTGVGDGRPRAGVDVVLHDTSGAARATGRTDARGVAVLGGFRRTPPVRGKTDCEDECYGGGFEGYVSAQLAGDRALVGINAYDPDLSPYEFGIYSAWGEDRAPVAAAVFTERGIYRPGEPVYAKAIVRRGPLGGLAPPAAGDSLRWRFTDRDGKPLRETTVALSRFGTADQTLRLGTELPLGQYGVSIQARRDGRWREVGTTSYQVAEYRPPEFLVEVAMDRQPRFAGQTVGATVGGRYLFGAPMAHAPVRWSAWQASVSPWEIDIPGTEGYQIGDAADGWDGEGDEGGPQTVASGVDTLDARGYRELRVKAEPQADGRPARLTVQAEVVDANRQSVTDVASVIVHPADFYVGAKVEGEGYFWSAGAPVRVGVIAVRPDGHAVAGVVVAGAVVRREWHRVRRERDGVLDEVGQWVSDTVATCRVTTTAGPSPCAFTPREGGEYTVSFTARDGQGRETHTAFTRWTVGAGWVPWNDEGKFKMDVIADKQRYSVGDTATILLASPFTDAEAWVTVERERVLEQRRIRITSGTYTLKLPITEAYAPNAFVSVVVVRGRTARPGTVDDPGRPTLRVGYVELRVTPEVKRLTVDVTPVREEYRPGDTAQVRLHVRDAAGRPQAAEVTLWAVDEGVLSLTRYKTPDPIDLIYQPRGLGMRLASNLVSVAPQVPEGQKGSRNPGGGGGRDATGVLRSRFRPTAFFLGSVVTDANGNAVASAALPDNVTTFRVMAVAVTAGDRYGSGSAPLRASKPLLARPSLPRFVREGDDFLAGVVVNHRFGGTVQAHVTASVTGLTLAGPADQAVTLATGRGAEARFRFTAPVGDSATFRFRAEGGGEGDAVQVRIPIRPANRPVYHAASGMLRDTATVELLLPEETDPARSRLELGFGTSPLTVLEAYRRQLEVYPYDCSEQLASQALPLIALERTSQAMGASVVVAGDTRARVQQLVRTLQRRQREDGGIGLWHSGDWTSPWLTAYAGRVLLEARASRYAVSDSVLARAARYLGRALHDPNALRPVLGDHARDTQWMLAERVAAADFLSRLGRPDVPAENLILGQAARLSWEDRLTLAEMLGRRGARDPAQRLLASAWAGVTVRGARAVLPDAAFRRDFYFASRMRPAARLLTATLALQPARPEIGALVETLVQQGQPEADRPWSTQDYSSALLALTRWQQTQRGAAERSVRVMRDGRVLAERRARRGEGRDSLGSLAGLVTTRADGRKVLRVSLQGVGSGPAVFYHLAVREVADHPVFTPRDAGIAVDRWYESVETRRPLTSVAEGQVVRVRLRITVPDERMMVVLDDPLPAGLEAVDLSLRTVSPFAPDVLSPERPEDRPGGSWFFGSWDAGMWSPFDHTEIRDDRVVYFARTLWKGTYNAAYLARATTAGRFTSAPAHAEEMYNPGVNGRSGGGVFVVAQAAP